MTSITTPAASNDRDQQDILPEIVVRRIAEAKRFHTASNDNAAGAVANCYMVWRDTFGPGADKLLRNWMDNRIEARNSEIEAHNKQINANRGLDKKIKAAQRLSMIKARNGVSKFVVIVKFVFDFVKHSDASMISRYSTVLDWVDSQLGHKVVQSADEVVTLIKDAGSLEQIILARRGRGPTMSADAHSAIAKAITANAMSAVAVADVKSVCDLTMEYDEGFVVLFGRYNGQTVEIVGDRKVADHELNVWVERFSDDIVLAVDETTEFVARVLSLGALVAEGAVTELTRHGTTSGNRLKEERVVTLLPHVAAGVEMLVSARHTDASVIIKARAHERRINLGTVVEPVMLDVGQCAELDSLLRRHGLRSLITIKPVHDIDGSGWIAANSALSGQPDGSTRVSWTKLAGEAHKPLNEDGFNARFSVDVSREALMQFYEVSLKEWEGITEKKAKDKPKLVTLTFHNNVMAYDCDGQETQKLEVDGKARNRTVLRFRPRDLVQLVGKLLRCEKVSQFTVSGDDASMMQINWADELGTYTICQPTSSVDGRLVYRRVAPINVEDPANDDLSNDDLSNDDLSNEVAA